MQNCVTGHVTLIALLGGVSAFTSVLQLVGSVSSLELKDDVEL